MVQISIILPVYNAEKYLRECLDSILNQTFKDFECICVNDGSKDSSLLILQEYAKKDNRIKVFDQENKGVYTVRNISLKLSTGKYIAFVDSDDFMLPNCLEKAYNKIEEENADVVWFNHKIYYQEEKVYKSKLVYESEKIKLTDTIAEVLQKTYEGPLWKRLYRKDLFLKHNLFFYGQRKSSEDGVFAAVLFLYVKKVVYLDDELYVYRKQVSHALTSDLNRLFIDWFYSFFTMIKDIKTRGFLSENVIKWCIHVFCWDYSRIGVNQTKQKQQEMLQHSILLLSYLLGNSKLFNNRFKLKILLFILNKFNMNSYKIVRVLKNFV